MLIGATLRQRNRLAARLRIAAVQTVGRYISCMRQMILLMPVAGEIDLPPSAWVRQLAALVVAVAEIKQIQAPIKLSHAHADVSVQQIAQALSGDVPNKAILLGNLALAHPQYN